MPNAKNIIKPNNKTTTKRKIKKILKPKINPSLMEIDREEQRDGNNKINTQPQNIADTDIADIPNPTSTQPQGTPEQPPPTNPTLESSEKPTLPNSQTNSFVNYRTNLGTTNSRTPSPTLDASENAEWTLLDNSWSPIRRVLDPTPPPEHRSEPNPQAHTTYFQQPITGLEKNKYFISRTFPRIIAAKASRGPKSFAWPEFIALEPNNLNLGIGDMIKCNSFRKLSETEIDNQPALPPRVIHMGIGPELLGPQLQTHTGQGFVINISKLLTNVGNPICDIALIHSDSSAVPNLVPLNPNHKLESGSLVGVVCKTLHIGSIIYNEYVLPQSFPISDSTAKRAGPATDIILNTISPAEYVFPFSVNRNNKSEINSIKTIAAALRTLSYTQNSSHTKASIYTTLNPHPQHQNNQVFLIHHTPKSLKELVSFTRIWEKDSPVIAAIEYEPEIPIAQGTIIEINSISDSFQLNISVHLKALPNQDDRVPRLEGAQVYLQIPFTPNQLNTRAESWASCEPLIYSEFETPQGTLMKQILGISTEPPLTNTRDLYYAMFAHDSNNPPNEEQLKAIDLTLNPKPSIVVTIAPPGTGKSKIIGLMALELMKNDKSPMIIAHSNLAMSKIVEYICPELSKMNKTALILLSARAKEQYMGLFGEYRDHLLISSLGDVDIESLKSRDRRIAHRYKDKAFSKPKMADEKSTAIIVLNSDKSPPN